ncbi:hypothetical protein [Phormidesmis sp. 146-33]
MTKDSFSDQIWYLLLTGAIQGEEILSLHRMLECYKQGIVNVEEMQKTINAHNPDLFLELPFDESYEC